MPRRIRREFGPRKGNVGFGRLQFGSVTILSVLFAVAGPTSHGRDLPVAYRALLAARELTATDVPPAAYYQRAQRPRCAVTIRQTMVTGEQRTVAFRSDLRTSAQCETLANLHRPNFEPERVRRKQVAFLWLGPADRAKATSRKKGSSGRAGIARRSRR